MRLLMFRAGDSRRIGALLNDTVIDLTALAEREGANLPSDLLGLIEGGQEALDTVQRLLQGHTQEVSTPLDEVQLLAPLDPPRGNILAIGRNYQEHAEESARARSEGVQEPTLFTKAQTSISGPYDDVRIDRNLTNEVDWEAELAVVIGRTALNIARDGALDHVFGYTVLNDLSARDLQFSWGGQFYKGKSVDGFCPIGPWIVTRDEIPDPQRLRVRCLVNGEVKQDASTEDMIYPVDDIIARVSTGMTIPAGTLIATGTPAGVGMGRTPKEFLNPGDVVETEVEGIGTLRNRMV